MATPPTAARTDASAKESREETAAARGGALAAARARIKVLETQLGLQAATPAGAPRVTAIAQSAELAAVRAERDSLQASLEAAERRALVASRQQRNEKERRTALAATLRQRDGALSRRSHERAQSSAAAAAVEQAASRREAEAAAEFAAPSPRPPSPHLRALRGRGVAYAGREALEEQLMEALDRATEAERLLASEMLAAERSTIDDAEQRALHEASAWQREAALQVRMTAAAGDAHSEARRAAALEAALAHEVEARQRDGAAMAEQVEALRLKVTEAQRSAGEEQERLLLQERERYVELEPRRKRTPRQRWRRRRRCARRARRCPTAGMPS